MLGFELLDEGVDPTTVGEGLRVNLKVDGAERCEVENGLEGRRVGW